MQGVGKSCLLYAESSIVLTVTFEGGEEMASIIFLIFRFLRAEKWLHWCSVFFRKSILWSLRYFIILKTLIKISIMHRTDFSFTIKNMFTLFPEGE